MRKEFSSSNLRKMICVAVASVSLGAGLPLALAGDNQAPSTINPTEQGPNQPNVYQSPAPLQLPPGTEQKDVGADSGVKSTLVGLTQRAVSKDSYDSFFHSFLSELASRDKSRAQEFQGVDQNQLNATIGQIQDAWRNKYGQDFDVSDKNLVFDQSFQIMQGDVTDNAQANNSWPVLCCTQIQSQQAGATQTPDLSHQGAGSQQQYPNTAAHDQNYPNNTSPNAATGQNNNLPPGQTAPEPNSANANQPSDQANAQNNLNDQQQSEPADLSNGQDIAVIQFPAASGFPVMNISLQHTTLLGWYVALPSYRTGEQVYNDLSSHLSYIANHQDQWPTDVNEGYRMVARHVAAALYGVPCRGTGYTPEAAAR